VRGLAFVFTPAVVSVAFAAAAEAPAPSGELDLAREPAKTPAAQRDGIYVHTFAELALGKGLRLNNPYRLATPIGDSPESLSWSAGYLDLGLGAAFGPPDALQHGGQVSLSVALDGIAQEVLALSYIALLPLGENALLRGRGGMPIVLDPDTSVGLELAAGGAWLFTGGFGISAELVGSLFYGAATLERPSTAIPLISLELGIWADYEVLP
jgi:hypothetical protein